MHRVPTSERASTVDLNLERLPTERALGVEWNVKSVKMIYNQLNRLDDKLKSTNKVIHIDLHACLTTQAENLHAVGHFKDQCPKSLNYSHNLGNTVCESIQRFTSWAAYYFTHPTSYFPIPDSSIPLKDISKHCHLSKTRHLNSNQEQIMRELAVQHNKCIRQRSLRQETTKFKGGTLPLKMYHPAHFSHAKDKIHLERLAQYQPAVPPIIKEQEEQESPSLTLKCLKLPEDDVQYDAVGLTMQWKVKMAMTS